MSPADAAAALAGVAAGAMVGLGAERLGHRLDLLDHPDPAGGRKLHARVTPLVGGLGVALAMAASVSIAGLANPSGVIVGRHLWVFGLTVLAMFLVGAADDRLGLSPVLRLGIAIGALALATWSAPDFRLSFLRFTGQDRLFVMDAAGGALFTLLCLVGLLNAVNMADGKNGIVSGMGLLWAVLLWTRLPPALTPVAAALAGCLGVLFAFNMRGRLFLGDSGSYALSAILGLLAIYSYNHGFAWLRADDLALMFAVPVFDTLRLIVKRGLQRRSPFAGDRDHFHHYLHRVYGWPGGLPWYLGLVALPNLAAALLPGTAPVWLAVTFVLYAWLCWRLTRPAGAFSKTTAAR